MPVMGECSKCGEVECPKPFPGSTVFFLAFDYETHKTYFLCECGEKAYLKKDNDGG